MEMETMTMIAGAIMLIATFVVLPISLLAIEIDYRIWEKKHKANK